MVTHLVIEPEDQHQLGRLVPLDLLDTTSGEISLRCTTTEFYQLPRAEKAQWVRGTGDYARYDQGTPVRPYFAQARSWPGAGVDDRLPQTFTYDVLPSGEVAVRGGDPVHAIDGAIGHITGVVIDAGSCQVACLLSQMTRRPRAGRSNPGRRLCAVPGLREALRLEERGGGRAPEQPHRGEADQPGQRGDDHAEHHHGEPSMAHRLLHAADQLQCRQAE